MGVYSNNPDYWKGSRSSSSNTERNGDVVVSGFKENSETLGRLMTKDPYMAQEMKTFIRKALKEARKNLSKDAANYMNSDPRKAARAVKYAVYKSLFGGNLSILAKRRAGTPSSYVRPHTLSPGQRGGNRIKREDDDRNRLDKYFGADRGFILRFISSGTEERESRYGKRGSIRQTDWFGHTAPWQLESAAEKVAEAINEYVKQQTNG
jgi:hypothetical protein